MENGLTTTGGNLPATATRNPFEDYGEAASGGGHIVGTMLKFSKGFWQAGKDSDDVPKGTQFIAVMNSLLVGWVKWEDSKPAEHRMVQIVSGEKPAKRSDLGDDDESKWEIDDNGRARDPWQLTNYCILVRKSDNEVFTFTTASFGGRGAIGELCKTYGKNMRAHPDQYPVISLDVNSYKHKDKALGKIYVPLLKIIGWTDRTAYDSAATGASAQAAEDNATREAADSSIPFDGAAAPKSPINYEAAAKAATDGLNIPPAFDRRTKSGKSQPRF